MNKDLASFLKSRLTMLPFVDVLAGLAETVEKVQYGGEDRAIITSRNRFPVATDVNKGDNEPISPETDLIPDSRRKSIIYFEDNGAVIGSTVDGTTNYTSNLRLVCWLNRRLLIGNDYQSVSAYCIASILKKVSQQNPLNFSPFINLTVKAIRLPVGDSGLFSRYTYDESVRQYLRPPFEAFGIDLVCNYKINPDCMPEIDFNNGQNC